MDCTTRLPGVDFVTLSQRRALEAIREARRKADAESTKTIRECNLDAVVRAVKPSTSSPKVVAAGWPPLPVIALALLAFVVFVASVVTLNSRSTATTATSAQEWRDGPQ